MSLHLPIVDQTSSLRGDGSRNFVHPADVHGRFTTRRNVVFAVLVAVYAFTPFLKIGGKPAVFLDVLHRRFHLFGATFNANDFWLVFFLLSGVGFALIVLTTLFGRVWCGYACPQTVFLEGVFRRLERFIEGPRNERIRRNKGPVTLDRLVRKTVKHSLFLVLCITLAHVFLSYFVSLPSLATMVRSSPSKHAEAFAWVVAFSAVTYFDFAWFREQVCLIICPYGRLQSVMTDRDTLIIGYDEKRGEPRGHDAGAGDCIDCTRCVQVCPTGIDIRNGLQIDCVGCASCIDACDEVMDKLERPRGLVRYDSQNGLAGGARRFFRPRVFLYGGFGVIGLAVAGASMWSRVPFEAHLLRSAGAVFVVDDATVTNPVRLHVVNKSDEPVVLGVQNLSDSQVTLEPPIASVPLRAGEARYVAIMVRVPRAAMHHGLRARLVVTKVGATGDRIELVLPILGPIGRPHG